MDTQHEPESSSGETSGNLSSQKKLILSLVVVAFVFIAGLFILGKKGDNNSVNTIPQQASVISSFVTGGGAGCDYDFSKIVQNGDFDTLVTGATAPDYVTSSAGSTVLDEVCYWEGSNANNKVFPNEGVDGTNAKKLSYTRNSGGGNTTNVQFNAHNITSGVVQAITPLKADTYTFSMKVKRGAQAGTASPTSGGVIVALTDTPIKKDNITVAGCQNMNSLLKMTPIGVSGYNDFAGCIETQFDKVIYASGSNNISSTDYTDISTTFTISATEEGQELDNLYILPFGYDPEFLIASGSTSGKSLNLFVDDVLIVGQTYPILPSAIDAGSCYAVVNQAATDPLYITPTGNGIGMEVSAGYQIPLGDIVDDPGMATSLYTSGLYFQRISGEQIHLDPLGSSSSYSLSDVNDMFTIVGGEFTEVEGASGGSTFVTFDCGDGGTDVDSDDQSGENPPTTMNTAPSISVIGNTNACGLFENGELYCWGSGAGSFTDGDIGSGVGNAQYIPTEAILPAGVSNSFAEVSKNCALHTDGRIFCVNGSGTAATQYIELDTSAAGVSNTFTDISGGKFMSKHLCAVHTNGKLYCQGSNHNGQLGRGTITTSSSTILPLAEVVMPGGTSNSFSSVSAGPATTCAIHTSGNQLYCWGNNYAGRAGVGGSVAANQSTPHLMNPANGVTNSFSMVSATGSQSTCAIHTGDNKLYCWGFNSFGQIGDGTDTTPSVATNPALADQFTFLPEEVIMTNGVTNSFSYISGGQYQNCAIHTGDNELYCWGHNKYGKLGIGMSTISVIDGVELPNPNPLKVVMNGGLAPTFSTVSLDADNVCGIHTNGNTYCWGFGYNSQLGIMPDSGTGYLPIQKNKPNLVDVTNVD